jgi:hypothetical protein
VSNVSSPRTHPSHWMYRSCRYTTLSGDHERQHMCYFSVNMSTRSKTISAVAGWVFVAGSI